MSGDIVGGSMELCVGRYQYLTHWKVEGERGEGARGMKFTPKWGVVLFGGIRDCATQLCTIRSSRLG